jgi:hypothetical protein
MIHVAFHFEDWIQHIGAAEPKTTMHRWSHNMKTLGVSKIWLVDCTTFQISQYYTHQDFDIEFEAVASLDDMEKVIGDTMDIVYLEVLAATSDNEASENLFNFVHPIDAVYVVGRDTSSIPWLAARSGPKKHWVHMPMKAPYSFYADIAMSCTLYARFYIESTSNTV